MSYKKSLAVFTLSCLASPLVWSACDTIPRGLSFMGLSGDRWDIYVSDNDNNPIAQNTKVEPRSFSVSPDIGSLAYVGVDDRLYLKQGGEESTLNKPDNRHSYTQPAFSLDGQSIYWVEMKDGNSKDTDIVAVNIESKKARAVVTQRSAQFEPAPYKESVYYSSVSCVNSCSNIIQELWMKDIVSGSSRQLTLLNQIAKQPVLSPSQNRLYFSSNASGTYGIWSYEFQSSSVQQVTNGAIDLYPAASANGDIFFVRRAPGGANLMCKSGNDAPVEVPLPDEIVNLRELKVAL